MMLSRHLLVAIKSLSMSVRFVDILSSTDKYSRLLGYKAMPVSN